MTWSKFRTEDPQILGTTVQNSVAQVIQHVGFVHPWAKKGMEVICSSVGLCCPFELRHMTWEREQHRPGHDGG